MYICMPPCTTKWGKNKRHWLLMLFHKTSYNGTEEKITKNIFKTHPFPPRHITTRIHKALCLAVCVLKRQRSLKAKHPERQRKGENMQIYLHVSWWCYTLFSNHSLQQQRGSSQWLRWANSELSQQWMDKEKVQDISCMPQTNCVNIFFSELGRNVFTHVLWTGHSF